MIKLTVRWSQRFTEIEFPCADSELQQKLREIRPPQSTSDIFVLSVHQPTALSMLEDQFLDMDEVNFLAKRMDSFTYDELLQFYAAAQYENFRTPRDLINLTYNLPCYTVIHDLFEYLEVYRRESTFFCQTVKGRFSFAFSVSCL